MVLLSMEKIREIQNVARSYVTKERAHLIRADAAVMARIHQQHPDIAEDVGGEKRVLDLRALTGHGRIHNLSGRLQGKAARESLDIDSIDREQSIVEVRIPDYVYAMSPSFLQGMFGPSIDACEGSRSAFARRFTFVGPPLVLRQIERAFAL